MSRSYHYFVAIYVGDSIASAKIAAASADSDLVREVAQKMLCGLEARPDSDPSIQAIGRGRKKALQLIVGTTITPPDDVRLPIAVESQRGQS